MHRRIIFGVTAWLLGAATATAGSLLAISLLGQGITGNSGQLLTQDAVNKALASEATEPPPPGSPTAPAGKAIATPTASPPAAPATASAAPTAPATPGQGPAPSSAPPPAAGDGTVLTSQGGEVVASCQAGGVYLTSWSPLQGYEVDSVTRGPAATARVTFASNVNQVIMKVSCSSGVPSATSYTRTGDE